MSDLTILSKSSPFLHDVEIDVEGKVVKIGCRESTFAELAELFSRPWDDFDRVRGSREYFGGEYKESDRRKLVEDMEPLIRICTGKELSECLEPEKSEKLYVVVDLGAEAAGVDDIYVVLGGPDGYTGDYFHVAKWPDKFGMPRGSAEERARDALEERGWHCAVREWPEKEQMWCVRYWNGCTKKQVYLSVGWLYNNEAPPIGPAPMAHADAVRVQKRMAELLKTSSPKHGEAKILPYPPPDKPVAVKWGIRDRWDNTWLTNYIEAPRVWQGEHGPYFYEQKEDAINRMNKKIYSYPKYRSRLEIVGFDADGNEVECDEDENG
jgi:hypothetical protein